MFNSYQKSNLLKCKFEFNHHLYVCRIENQEIPLDVNAKSFECEHEGNLTNDVVDSILICESSCPEIPDKFGEVFKNVTDLCIFASKLQKISKQSLKQFPYLVNLSLYSNELEKLPKDLFEFNRKLKVINLCGNKIQSFQSGLLDELHDLEIFWINENQLKFVPGDLFKFNKKIKRISFSGIEIKFIGPELLDGLKNLEWVNFFGNPCNIGYDKSSDDPQKLDEIKQKMKSLLKSSKITQDQPSCSGLLKTTSKCSQFHNDLDHLLTLNDFKDFTVKITSAKFKVHKFLLVARSETLAELIKNKPNAGEMILTDISVEIFDIILKFLYTDETPKDSKNAREIFSAASKLKIKKLKEIYGEILTEEVEKVKDLRELWEIYNLGMKHKNKNLTLKAFERIRKKIQGVNLKDELLEQHEKLKKIIDAKLAFDESLK